jgi:Ion channel
MSGKKFLFIFVFVVLPLLGNGLFVGRLLSAPLSSYWWCYAITAVSALLSVLALLGYIVKEVPPSAAVTSCAVQPVLLILIFACMYCDLGLLGSPMPPQTIGTGIYFSIVTWTTLGYGDLHPSAGLWPVAAAEAVIGYLFSGILIGLLTAAFVKLRP